LVNAYLSYCAETISGTDGQTDEKTVGRTWVTLNVPVAYAGGIKRFSCISLHFFAVFFCPRHRRRRN